MEPPHGYFCRAYVGQDVQANVIARTLREAEQEITRMIRGGAMTAHAVSMGDMHRRTQIAVEGLHLGEAEGIFQRRQFGFWIALRDVGEHRRRLGQDPPVGDQRRDASLGIDGEIFR